MGQLHVRDEYFTTLCNLRPPRGRHERRQQSSNRSTRCARGSALHGYGPARRSVFDVLCSDQRYRRIGVVSSCA